MTCILAIKQSLIVLISVCMGDAKFKRTVRAAPARS